MYRECVCVTVCVCVSVCVCVCAIRYALKNMCIQMCLVFCLSKVGLGTSVKVIFERWNWQRDNFALHLSRGRSLKCYFRPLCFWESSQLMIPASVPAQSLLHVMESVWLHSANRLSPDHRVHHCLRSQPSGQQRSSAKQTLMGCRFVMCKIKTICSLAPKKHFFAEKFRNCFVMYY